MDSNFSSLDEAGHQSSGIPERVRQAALKHGIQKHRLVTFLSEKLGYDRHKVHRRMSDNPPWQRAELVMIASLFNIPVEKLLGVDGQDATSPSTAAKAPAPATDRGELAFLDNTVALVELGDHDQEDHRFVAVRVGATLRVYKRAEAPSGMPLLPVRRFTVEPATRHVVAIIEDDSKQADLLSEALREAGLDSKTFPTLVAFDASMKRSQRFDAYVFDWYLGRSGTAEGALPKVRGEQPLAPVFITSGKIDKAGERHLTEICDAYKITLVEKPFRPSVLAMQVRRLLIETPAPPAR